MSRLRRRRRKDRSTSTMSPGARRLAQSSTYTTAALAWPCQSTATRDGAFNAGSVSHTNSAGQCLVGGGSGHEPSRCFGVRVWNRADCCCRAPQATSTCSPPMRRWRVARSPRCLADPAVVSVPGCPERRTRRAASTSLATGRARYVRVQLAGTDFLQLAEAGSLRTSSPPIDAPTSGPTQTPSVTLPWVSTVQL